MQVLPLMDDARSKTVHLDEILESQVPLGSPELILYGKKRRTKAPLAWLQQHPLTLFIFKGQPGEAPLSVRPINLLLEGAHILPQPNVDKGIIRWGVMQRHTVMEQPCLLGFHRSAQKLTDQPCTVWNGQYVAPIP